MSHALSAALPWNATLYASAPSDTDDPGEDVTVEIEDHIPDQFQEMVSSAGPFMGILLGSMISAVVALLVAVVSSMIMKQVFRKKDQVKQAVNRTRVPLFGIVFFAGTALSVRFAQVEEHWWRAPLYVTLLIAVIVSVAWWALRVVKIVEAIVLGEYLGDGQPGIEDRRGRRLQTQVNLIGRILAAVIITLAVAAVLLLNEAVRGLGAGLLASAGVASVVAGLAMQSTLTNVFAGIQLAFTDSIRVGDVVSIEGNFGTVEEITLSTVVIKSWDERRFIYPSQYFVGTPFENWTRVGTDLLGTVELDVDWRVPMDALRARLRRLLETTDLWDGGTGSLQVSEAVEGRARVWVVVSARNSGELWDLRCLVREDLVNYLRTEHPYAVVTQRMLISSEEALSGQPDPVATGQLGRIEAEASTETPPGHDAGETAVAQADEGLFTGSISAVQRNRDLSGPGEDAYRERRERYTDDEEEQSPSSHP